MKEPFNDLVSVELGKELKEKGFNYKTLTVYLVDTDNQHQTTVHPLDWNKHEELISIPTLSQAKKWLREEKKMDVRVWPEYYINGINWLMGITWWFGHDTKLERGDRTHGGTFEYGDNSEFDTYEDALEFGIRLGLRRMEFPMDSESDMSRDEIYELHKGLLN